MATIKEVAKLAGVSTSTVSRALSGKIPVDAETRARVLSAVERLDYRPNPLAKGLKEGHTSMLALVVPDIVNPFFPKMVKCFERRARDMGYSLILCDSGGDPEQELRHLEAMKSRYIDGVLYISAMEGAGRAAMLKESGVPVVVVNREYAVDAPCFTNDNRRGAFTMIDYLYKKGHRKIACLAAPLAPQHYSQRYDGCLDAFRAHGIDDYEKYMVHNVETVEDAYGATRELLGRPDRPTAIFAFIDYAAMGVYSGVAAMGLSVPGDVSVAGFDDIVFSRHLIPPLTTYAHPVDEIARQAMAAIIDEINGKGSGYRRIEIDGWLVERDSVRRLD